MCAMHLCRGHGEGERALASKKVDKMLMWQFYLLILKLERTLPQDEHETQMSKAEGCGVSAWSINMAALTGVGSKSSGSSTNGLLVEGDREIRIVE